MTIKIEFPSDRKDIALAIGRALCEIGGEAVVKEMVKAGELEHTVGKTLNAYGQLTADGAGLIDETGPFYWVHHESCSYGIVDNKNEVPKDELVEFVEKDVYDKLVNEWDPQPEPLSEDINADKLGDVPPPSDDSELDARGFPWDKRIHSANKSKNTDGTWRYSRKPKNFETKEQWNIYIEQIEEELKGEDVPPPVTDEPNAGDVFGQSETPPPVEDDVPPPPADEYPEKTFGELMTLITSNQKNGSVAAINDVLAEMGITGTGNSALPVLKSDHPERISEAYAKLEGKL